MQTFVDFFSLKDPNVFYVVVGMVLINASSALIGTFAYLRKRALIGDAIAHALLPGLCIGFLFAQEKNISYLLVGAFLSGWLATYAIDFIVNKSKVKQDAAIGIVLSSFFAFGIVLLTYIQKNAGGQHSGLDSFLFGQAAAINKSELYAFAIILTIIILALILFYRSFVITAFNTDFAKSIGLPVRFIEFLLTALTVLAIAAGIQALGVILMSALIVIPAAAARLWTHHLKFMLLLAGVISIVAGVGGAFVSYAKSGMPTGPWVVVFLAFFMLISIVFAPQKGFFARFRRARNNKLKIQRENILKAVYEFHENQGEVRELKKKMKFTDFLAMRLFETSDLMKGMKRLVKSNHLIKDGDHYYLSSIGVEESRRVVRLHRLWEHYLLKRTSIDEQHVHSGAEAMEHIITDEIAIELEKELGVKGVPKKDF